SGGVGVGVGVDVDVDVDVDVGTTRLIFTGTIDPPGWVVARRLRLPTTENSNISTTADTSKDTVQCQRPGLITAGLPG
ncbi:MAG: hypothetical protein WA888_08410, partial [Burkholderiaceae bacterium]